MRREIKFRFWDVADSCWVTPSLVEFSYQDVDNESVGVPFHLYGKEIIIQQYNGLKDKNDKEIYEGDILERIGNGSFCKIVICWDDQNCRFISKNSFNLHGDGSPISNNIINISDWTYWVVCGNIMENPELIQ